jgi:hypothetical protein
LRTLTDADGVVWTVIEDEVLGGQPMQQHAAVFTAADGRRRWVRWPAVDSRSCRIPNYAPSM